MRYFETADGVRIPVGVTALAGPFVEKKGGGYRRENMEALRNRYRILGQPIPKTFWCGGILEIPGDLLPRFVAHAGEKQWQIVGAFNRVMGPEQYVFSVEHTDFPKRWEGAEYPLVMLHDDTLMVQPAVGWGGLVFVERLPIVED